MRGRPLSQPAESPVSSGPDCHQLLQHSSACPTTETTLHSTTQHSTHSTTLTSVTADGFMKGPA